MIYLYETPARPSRLVLTAEGQPSLTLSVSPTLYAGLRQLALMHEGLFLASVQLALDELFMKMEAAWLTEPPARIEEPMAPTEDEDVPFEDEDLPF